MALANRGDLSLELAQLLGVTGAYPRLEALGDIQPFVLAGQVGGHLDVQVANVLAIPVHVDNAQPIPVELGGGTQWHGALGMDFSGNTSGNVSWNDYGMQLFRQQVEQVTITRLHVVCWNEGTAGTNVLNDLRSGPQFLRYGQAVGTPGGTVTTINPLDDSGRTSAGVMVRQVEAATEPGGMVDTETALVAIPPTSVRNIDRWSPDQSGDTSWTGAVVVTTWDLNLDWTMVRAGQWNDLAWSLGGGPVTGDVIIHATMSWRES